MAGLKKNYSQVWQDIFALVVNDAKRDGTFIEIGGAQPFIGNNTWLLEKEYNWRGFSVELDEELCKMWMGGYALPGAIIGLGMILLFSKFSLVG